MLCRETEQELAYGRLLSQRVTDVAQWQAAHRILPAYSPNALKTPTGSGSSGSGAAALRLGWDVMLDWAMLMTETPAQTATRLGGLVDFNERLETAVFSLRDSAEIFSKRYPTWNVQVEVKERQTA